MSNCVGGDGDFAADGVFHGFEVVGDGVEGEAFLAGLEGGAVGCLDGGHVCSWSNRNVHRCTSNT